MEQISNISPVSNPAHSAEHANFIQKVFGWMFVGLALTAVVAYFISTNESAIMFFIGNPLIFYGLLILELVAVIYLSAMVSKVSAYTAIIVFLLYAALNGLTFSLIFLVYTSASIALSFLVTAGTFGIMSLYGYFTKTDLTTVGNIMFMGLIGLILASIVNLFLNNPMIYWILTYAGILIFVGLTAYDIQKIKNMNIIGNEGTEQDTKESIMGALTLYLDFINLFLHILRLFGKRR
jgi:FtsH-binding integral membrane protein